MAKATIAGLKARLYSVNSRVYEAQRKFEKAVDAYYKRLSRIYTVAFETFSGGEVSADGVGRFFSSERDCAEYFGTVHAWSGEPIRITSRASEHRARFWQRARGGWHGKFFLSPDIDARDDLRKIEARLDKYSAARESAERKRAVLFEQLKAVGCDYGEYQPIFHE